MESPREAICWKEPYGSSWCNEKGVGCGAKCLGFGAHLAFEFVFYYFVPMFLRKILNLIIYEL